MHETAGDREASGRAAIFAARSDRGIDANGEAGGEAFCGDHTPYGENRRTYTPRKPLLAPAAAMRLARLRSRRS